MKKVRVTFKLHLKWKSEVYLQPCQISMMEHFVKIVNSEKVLTNLARSSIINVKQGSTYPSENMSGIFS